jgi:hypothetical protein
LGRSCLDDDGLDDICRSAGRRSIGRWSTRSAARRAQAGKFHYRDRRSAWRRRAVIRLNRDTLYSSAVFDLDAGAATITLPDAGKRFMSMQVISEDHYVPEVVYGKGSHTLTKEKDGSGASTPPRLHRRYKYGLRRKQRWRITLR